MSKIIDFCARDFRLDGTCSDNVGERILLTTDLGNREVWEIGDWKWKWTQIFCEKILEKNTDYILRFAVSGGYCGTWDSVCKLWIYHTDGYDTRQSAWEDRTTVRLDNDGFAPIISKNDRTGVIRVFEVPFNTGDFENWRITFVAQHAVTRFMEAGENSAYEKLENLTLKELREQTEAECAENKNRARINLSGACVTRDALNDILFNAPKNAYLDLSGMVVSENDTDDTASAVNIVTSNVEYTETEFWELLRNMKDGTMAEYSNITVKPDSEPGANVILGAHVDGAILTFGNVTLTSLAMSAIIAKLGDGCIVNLQNISVTPDGLGAMIGCGSSDGVVINLSNASLPEPVLALIKNKSHMGDGCVLCLDAIKTFPA